MGLKSFIIVIYNNNSTRIEASNKSLPGSVASRVCGGGWLRGPGVPPEPGERTSSFTAPPYDSDDDGGLC